MCLKLQIKKENVTFIDLRTVSPIFKNTYNLLKRLNLVTERLDELRILKYDFYK